MPAYLNDYEKKAYHNAEATFEPVKDTKPSCWGCSGTGKILKEFGVANSIYSDVREIDCPNLQCPFKGKGEEKMVEEKGVVRQEATDLTLTRNPAEAVKLATEASEVLKQVVTKAGLVTRIGPSEHLQFEAWQTLGQFYGVTVKIESTARLDENNEFYGYEAAAVVLRNGEIISRAEAMCCVDEKNWEKKPRFQLRSMAQTRACGKALRNVLSWIVVLAGYRATPAEEMTNGFPESDTSTPRPIKIKDPAAPATPAQIKAALALCHKIGDIMKESDFHSMTKQEISDYISNAQKV